MIGGRYKHKTMLLKQNWKLVGMEKETMTNLISRLQLFVTAMHGSSNNWIWESILLAINRYWEQAFYNCFYYIDNLLSSNKYFCGLGTIIRCYKGT